MFSSAHTNSCRGVLVALLLCTLYILPSSAQRSQGQPNQDALTKPPTKSIYFHESIDNSTQAKSTASRRWNAYLNPDNKAFKLKSERIFKNRRSYQQYDQYHRGIKSKTGDIAYLCVREHLI